MIIILSQKIDTSSGYEGDELYKVYHYPAKYKNQIHSGDIFVYYQGDRYVKANRYYFGMGEIGEIRQEDNDNYFVELLNGVKFKIKVPIYLPQEGYVEQLDYEEIRKSKNPPWQSSIRPLSRKAYEYILSQSGGERTINNYNNDLKEAIRSYFMAGDKKALVRIIKYAKLLREIYDINDDE